MHTCRKKRFVSITYRTFLLLFLLVAQSTFMPKFLFGASLHLAWNANTEIDLSGYKIYCGKEPGNYEYYVDVGNVTEYPLDDLELQEEEIYYIAITAYDINGNESDFSRELDYFAHDEVPDDTDNCPENYNSDQEDTYPPLGNGIGDACDCEADFDCDGYVDAYDVQLFIVDFGRDAYYHPCDDPLWGSCNGDFDCDGDVDEADIVKFLEDFGRDQFNNPCPICDGRDWCSY